MYQSRTFSTLALNFRLPVSVGITGELGFNPPSSSRIQPPFFCYFVIYVDLGAADPLSSFSLIPTPSTITFEAPMQHRNAVDQAVIAFINTVKTVTEGFFYSVSPKLFWRHVKEICIVLVLGNNLRGKVSIISAGKSSR